MITGLDHIALAVHDLDAAVKAYRKLLGREPNWLGGDGGARHAWFQLSNMALGLASRGYILQTGEIVLADSAAKLAQDPAVQKAYLGG